MYQSIFYDKQQKIIYLRDDIDGWSQQKYTPQVYKRIKEYQEGAYKVLTGGYALPLLKNKKWEWDDINILEKDISPELSLLRDLYHEFDGDIPKYHNLIFLDIECEIFGVMNPENIKLAPTNLTSIALLDYNTKNKYCFVLDTSKEIQITNQDGKFIIPCHTEKELCLKFLDKWEELDPTIVSGWNSKHFDLPFLYYRMVKVIGEEQTQRLSPIRKIDTQSWNFKENNIIIGGINHVDYLLLHKKYVIDEEPSYKLGNIGEKYVKLGKIEYEGNLNQLFKNDINKFIDYNLRDVEIIEKLEDKLKFIELTISLCHICNCNYESIYYNTVLNEAAILKYLKKLNIVSPNKPTTTNPQLKEFKYSYSGGYLKEPIPNIYKNVIDLDFTSLYKNIIQTLNIGVDSFLGQIKLKGVEYFYQQNLSLDLLKNMEPTDEVVFTILNKENYKQKETTTTVGKILKIIQNNNYRISPSGAIFSNEEGVCSKILQGWSDKREYYRELKKKAGKEKDWNKANQYDILQKAFKIQLVALYGTFAINSWRYSDGQLLCSSAITNCGQVLTKQSIEFVNNFLSQKYGEEDYVTHSDTDSIFIKLDKILKTDYPGITDKKEKNEKLLEYANTIQKEANLNLYNISKNMFNNENHVFELKQEVIIESLLTTAKRRYAMYITNSEGVEVDEMIMKGLELKKSNLNPLFQEFGTNFIKQILFDTPQSQLDQLIIDLYKKIKTLDPKTLGKPTGVSYINKCIKRSPSSGEILSELHLNTKPNSSGSIYYNDLLRFKGLNKKFPEIMEGAKVYVIDLIKNPYNINYISIPVNEKIPDFMEDFIKKYANIDQIFESSILNKLKELYKDLKMEFPNLNPKISRFFKFS